MISELVFVFLAGASPIVEIRGAVPLGILVYKLPVLTVYIVSVLGNFFITPFLLIFLRYLSKFLMRRFYFFNRLLNYIFSKTRDHHTHKFEKWEHWALLVLVAIPLPFTGAWTGSVASFLFDIPVKKSLAIIFLGIILAGLAVTALTLLGETIL